MGRRGTILGDMGSHGGNSSGRNLGIIKVLLSKVQSHCLLSSSWPLWRRNVWDSPPLWPLPSLQLLLCLRTLNVIHPCCGPQGGSQVLSRQDVRGGGGGWWWMEITSLQLCRSELAVHPLASRGRRTGSTLRRSRCTACARASGHSGYLGQAVVGRGLCSDRKALSLFSSLLRDWGVSWDRGKLPRLL